MKVCFQIDNKIFETGDMKLRNYVSDKTLIEVIKEVLNEKDHEDKDRKITIIGRK